MERTVTRMLFILMQYGIVPERITLPRTDDGILSGYDEDVSSKRDGHALWGLLVVSALLRHLVTSGSAKPVFSCCPRPKALFTKT